MLVSRKEPHPIANSRAAKVRREVAVPRAFVPTLQSAGAGNRASDRLAGQAGWLPIVRRVVQEPLASLPGDHIDHGALDGAELGGRPHGLDLYFLNEVDAGFGSRDAVA